MFQVDHFGLGVILFEIQNVLDVRPAEAVDALPVVADHTEVPVLFGEHVDEQVLRLVGVLVLVHHYVAEPILVFFQDLRIFGKYFDREIDDVVEVEGVVVLELFLVLSEDARKGFFIISVGLLREKFRVDHVVFRAADRRQKSFRVELVGVYFQLLHDPFDHGLLVLGVDYMEGAFVSQSFYLGPKDPHADGVERPDDRERTPVGGVQNGGDPLFHFLGGFVGERHGQDVARTDTRLLYKEGDAVGEGFGFP